MNAKIFKTKQMLEGTLFVGRHRSAQRYEFRFLSRQSVSQPVSLHSEVVPDRALEGNLLQRRGAQVAARGSESQFRRAVLQDLEHEQRRRLVCSALSINES